MTSQLAPILHSNAPNRQLNPFCRGCKGGRRDGLAAADPSRTAFLNPVRLFLVAGWRGCCPSDAGTRCVVCLSEETAATKNHVVARVERRGEVLVLYRISGCCLEILRNVEDMCDLVGCLVGFDRWGCWVGRWVWRLKTEPGPR
jgi:hypothetical protein